MSTNQMTLEPMNRPRFFAGQLVDYRDFNRISEQADKTVTLLCQYLFSGGGVIVDALDEFRVDPNGGMSAKVEGGVALLPNGQAVCMPSPQIIDLSPFKTAAGAHGMVVVVSLVHSVVGADRFVDESDPSVTGFRSEIIAPKIVCSAEKPASGGIELFRVFLGPSSKRLRLATANEGWGGPSLKSEQPDEAVIDDRFRERIVPQTFLPFSATELIALRSALYSIENSHRKIARLYLVKDPFHSIEYLTQAHAEILSRPFQPLKVSFLVSEFAEKLCAYFELLLQRLGASKTKYDEKSLYEVVTALTPFRVKEITPRYQSFAVLSDVANGMERFVNYALENYHLVSAIEEALQDLRHRHQDFGDKMLLAGHLFERIDLVQRDSKDKLTVKSDESNGRLLKASFANGDRMEMKGLFFKKGVLTLELQVANPEQLACVLMHQYVRRAGSSIQYEINGKPIGADIADIPNGPREASNVWINRGLVISAENLIQGKNLLRIIVDRADLEFAFFDCAVYQPISQNQPAKKGAMQ